MFARYGLVNFTPFTKVDEFAQHLREGRLMGSRCKACGHVTFPPRADCGACLSPDFEFHPYSGEGIVHTHTLITAPPAGFEALAPYHVGLVDLTEGGRLVAWFGARRPPAEAGVGGPRAPFPRVCARV